MPGLYPYSILYLCGPSDTRRDRRTHRQKHSSSSIVNTLRSPSQNTLRKSPVRHLFGEYVTHTQTLTHTHSHTPLRSRPCFILRTLIFSFISLSCISVQRCCGGAMTTSTGIQADRHAQQQQQQQHQHQREELSTPADRCSYSRTETTEL